MHEVQPESDGVDDADTIDVDSARRARAYLLRVAEPPAPALEAFVVEHGPVTAARRVAEGWVPDAVDRETSARRHLRLGEEDLAAAWQHGARLVIPEDAEWPAWPLLCLDVAYGRGRSDLAGPLGLWVRGTANLDEAARSAIAIVGARAATAYGEQNAADFGYELAQRGSCVFSGAAYGIDGGAHRGALAAGGPTVAVLGCGLDAGYPAGHVGLLDRIAERGAVVSEYPPGTPPARHRFLVRNRLIAALSGGTVVVEAGLRSGARNTATTAGVLGKAVLAVPGPVSSAMSAGCHQMIRRMEATLVTSVAEVAETAGPLCAQPPNEPQAAPRATDTLSPTAARVHGALDRRNPKSTERIATDSGVSRTEVRSTMPLLEIEGLAHRDDNGWRSAGNRR